MHGRTNTNVLQMNSDEISGNDAEKRAQSVCMRVSRRVRLKNKKSVFHDEHGRGTEGANDDERSGGGDACNFESHRDVESR